MPGRSPIQSWTSSSGQVAEDPQQDPERLPTTWRTSSREVRRPTPLRIAIAPPTSKISRIGTISQAFDDQTPRMHDATNSRTCRLMAIRSQVRSRSAKSRRWPISPSGISRRSS